VNKNVPYPKSCSSSKISARNMSINSALIFGAGFGTRMGEITKITPKPMVPILNKPFN
jgi:hypothetical protein